VKVAFDEHVPPALFSAFSALQDHTGLEGCEIVGARSYSPGPGAKDDIPWIEAFAKDGGKVIVSGEKKMRSSPYVQRAIQESGVVAFFLPPAWNTWDMYSRTAFILKWWKRMVKHAQISSAGTLWIIPANWTTGEFESVKIPQEAVDKGDTASVS
jgi:hypothetical protein